MGVLRKKAYVDELRGYQKTIDEKLWNDELSLEAAAFLMGAYSALERLDRDLYIFDWGFADTVLACKSLLLRRRVKTPYPDVAVFADAGKYLVAQKRGDPEPFGACSQAFGRGLAYSLRRLYRTPGEIETARQVMAQTMELELAGPVPYAAVRDLPNLWHYPPQDPEDGPDRPPVDEIGALLA